MKKKKRTLRKFSLEEKIKAVLSIWSERRSASEICREMSISWTLLNNWQNIAMEGMMRSLEPKKPEKLPVLSTRLEKLLEKKVMKRSSSMAKLEERLENIRQKSLKTV